MLEKSTKIKIKNATNSKVGYLIPDFNNLYRSFMPGESKEITYEELEKLSFVPGGETLLRNHLIIDNKEALASILGDVEPEYFYTEKDVRYLLSSGTIDQFMDFLDFAPVGMINLAKDLAVSTELNDVRKREAIKNKTGFDVTKAIQINNETLDEVVEEEKMRRATPVKIENDNFSTESDRRVTTPAKPNIIVKH